MTARGWLWSSALIVALGAVAAAAWAWSVLHTPLEARPGGQVTFVASSGASAEAILRRLEDEGILASADLARIYLIAVLGDPPLKAGEYRFVGAHTTPEVLAKLIRGEVATHSVTLVEGLTLRETASHLAAAGFGDFEALVREMESPDEIADLDPEAESLEGYLFPDTYHFARGTRIREIVATLVATFRQRFEAEIRPRLVQGDAGGARRTVTLASIVEKEALLDSERPLIAGVYANRLRRGMPLAADPTIIYALKQEGRWDGNLRRADLKLDSPYNTYAQAGLPPGPICSPGLASLRAAADPAEVPYLYFVSRNDGSHAFARTFAEHRQNVQRWQRRYWRERRTPAGRGRQEGD